jgi:hypothetical protein
MKHYSARHKEEEEKPARIRIIRIINKTYMYSYQTTYAYILIKPHKAQDKGGGRKAGENTSGETEKGEGRSRKADDFVVGSCRETQAGVHELNSTTQLH